MRAQDTNFNPAGVMETVVRKTKSAAAIGALLVVLSPISGHVANAAEKPIIPQDPYELMEPAGKSYLGKKGPNLQLPTELSADDPTPVEKPDLKKMQLQVDIDWLNDLTGADIAAALIWGVVLYYGIFDINLIDNKVSQASGREGDVRPSDWMKVRLGEVLGMGQATWTDDWDVPVALQAFTLSLFALLGFGAERAIAVGTGNGNGVFPLSAALASGVWAGVYELGRTQQKGYKLTREEQEREEQQQKDFNQFCRERVEVKPSGRVHISELSRAFREQYGRYRTTEQMSDNVLKGYFRAFAKRNTGMKGRQGFYKGIALKERASAFGADPAAVQRLKEEQERRQEEKAKARADAESAAQMAVSRASLSEEKEPESKEEVALEGGSAGKRSQEV